MGTQNPNQTPNPNETPGSPQRMPGKENDDYVGTDPKRTRENENDQGGDRQRQNDRNNPTPKTS